jgi:protein CpxP
MKRETLLTLAVLALLVINTGTLLYVFTSNKKQGPPFGNPRVDRLIIEGLQLNENQIGQFDELKHDHRSRINEVEREERKLQKVYFELLQQSQPDHQVADSISGLLGSIQEKKLEITFDHFSDLKGICTDEQKVLFDSLIGDISRALMMPPKRPPHP